MPTGCGRRPGARERASSTEGHGRKLSTQSPSAPRAGHLEGVIWLASDIDQLPKGAREAMKRGQRLVWACTPPWRTTAKLNLFGRRGEGNRKAHVWFTCPLVSFFSWQSTLTLTYTLTSCILEWGKTLETRSQASSTSTSDNLVDLSLREVRARSDGGYHPTDHPAGWTMPVGRAQRHAGRIGMFCLSRPSVSNFLDGIKDPLKVFLLDGWESFNP